jgi:hypothetical protein
MWAAASIVSEHLELRFGGAVEGFVLPIGGFIGLWLYAPVRNNVASWRAKRQPDTHKESR